MARHCRHSIFCILPPHVLKNIAKNGTPEQRDAALNALSVDHSIRTDRLTYTLMGGLQVPHASGVTAGTPQKQRTIYDDKHSENLPGSLVRSEGQAAVADQ